MIGVVLVNWNGREDTLECIASLKKLDPAPSVIVMVDNGSTDGSVAAVGAAFPDVRTIVNGVNTGFCRGANAGIADALSLGCRYLLVLNNDTVVERCLLKELKAVLDADESVAAVVPVIGEYSDPSRSYFHGTKIDWANGDLCSQYTREAVAAAKGPLNVDFATWCCVMVRAVTLRRVGPLDERFFAYYEDTEWSLRARKRGMRILMHPHTLVLHKVSRSSGGPSSPLSWFYLFRNRLLFMKTHAPAFRKLQFASHYARDAFRQYRKLSACGELESAGAVLDGFWSALAGCTGAQRVPMPREYLSGRKLARLRLLTLKAVM